MNCTFCRHTRGGPCGRGLNGGFCCTRRKGHLGAHIACGGSLHFLEVEFTKTDERITFTLNENLPVSR